MEILCQILLLYDLMGNANLRRLLKKHDGYPRIIKHGELERKLLVKEHLICKLHQLNQMVIFVRR